MNETKKAVRIDDKFLRVTMPDGSKWDVPVKKIAEHRARYNEDTIPAFENDEYEIQNWAENNMDWKNIVAFARKVESHPMTDKDFQEGWINGDKEIVEEPK